MSNGEADSLMAPSIEAEAAELERLLVSKTVSLVRRHRAGELLLQFTDGTRLFVNEANGGLEFSVTGPDENGPNSR